MKSTIIANKVVEYILTRKLDEIASLTVDSVASSLNMHRSHLSRTFTQERDCTIEDFIFKIKITHAASLLKQNNKLNIKEVAKMIGFARSDYFIRIFKHYFGTTPAKYRSLVRGL